MSVVDRWHKTRPRPGDSVCHEHGQVPTAAHGSGKRWQVRWRDETGAQKKENCARKADASRRDAQVHEQLRAGTYVDPAASRITFEAYAEGWRSALTCDPHTATNVRSRLTVHAYPVLGRVPMVTLARRPSLIQRWISGLELAPSTAVNVASIVSSVFRAAVDDQIVPRNPFDAGSVRLPRVIKPRVVPWTLDQVAAMSRALPDRWAVLPWLGVGVGARQGELFAVARDDIDFLGRAVGIRRQVRVIDGTLVFSLPKGHKERTVPLADATALRLSAHIAEHGTTSVTLPWHTPSGEQTTADLLLTTTAGGAIHRNSFNKAWRAARRAVGVPDTRANGVHVCRHTAASAWLAQGVDVRTVAEFLGHADPAVTLRRYAHLMPDAADRARRAMDAWLGDAACARDVPSEGTA